MPILTFFGWTPSGASARADFAFRKGKEGAFRGAKSPGQKLSTISTKGASARVTAIQSGGGGYAGIAELDLRVQALASASSEYSSAWAASKAFDDSASTYWCNSSGATGWLQYDFGAGKSKVVAGYRIAKIVCSASVTVGIPSDPALKRGLP